MLLRCRECEPGRSHSVDGPFFQTDDKDDNADEIDNANDNDDDNDNDDSATDVEENSFSIGRKRDLKNPKPNSFLEIKRKFKKVSFARGLLEVYPPWFL